MTTRNRDIATRDAPSRAGAAARPEPGQAIAPSDAGSDVPAHFTIWGLSPTQLHDAYWKSRGVQCVRPLGDAASSRSSTADLGSDATRIDRSAELYLLLHPNQLVFFSLADVINRVQWRGATVTRLWINLPVREQYTERIDVDAGNRVRSIRRHYRPPHLGQHRVFLTRSRRLARLWLHARTPRDGWHCIRQRLRLTQIDRTRTTGATYTTSGPDAHEEQLAAVRSLVENWARPESTIIGLREAAPNIFTRDPAYTDPQHINRHAALDGVCIQPLWIGDDVAEASGDVLDVDAGDAHRACIVGPGFVADTGDALTPLQTRRFIDIFNTSDKATDLSTAHSEPGARRSPSGNGAASVGADRASSSSHRRRGRHTAFAGTTTLIHEPGHGTIYPVAKRAFDIVTSATVLLLMLPVFAFVGAGIVMTDGRPVFFRHRRQSRGGAPFGCLKFRTMTTNASSALADIKSLNQCDGPQVFIPNDPRITRFGAALRALNIDEIPQFWNVLKGDMSIVGPRPSPDAENQLCPAWRDLRLSVRPGVTGLWQLKRTRAPGQDFQEWIQYDIEYVRNASFLLDLKICVLTAKLLLLGSPPSPPHATADDPDQNAPASTNGAS